MAPRGGKASDQMMRFLAAELGVSRTDIEAVVGRMSVNEQKWVESPKGVHTEMTAASSIAVQMSPQT